MQNAEYFDLLTKTYGGRHVYPRPDIFDKLVLRYNLIFDLYSKDPNLLRPFPKIIYDFVENSNFNAFALNAGPRYIIGVNWSVFVLLSDIFSRMLANPNILKNIGDVSKEKLMPQISDYYTNAFDLFDSFENSKYIVAQPIDNIRKKYADLLTLLAMDFIFEHELSHILFGHVDYINDKYGIKIFSEFSNNDVQIKNNTDFQTLEMDADSTV